MRCVKRIVLRRHLTRIAPDHEVSVLHLRRLALQRAAMGLACEVQVLTPRAIIMQAHRLLSAAQV